MKEQSKNPPDLTNEKDVTIVNIYAPNIGAPQNIRQILTAIKG